MITSLVASRPDAFSVSLRLLRIVPLVSANVSTWSLYPLSLIRKLADPISTKLHCMFYPHAVASIYSVHSKLHAALSFPFYLPMHPIFHPHVCTDTTCGGAPLSAPIHPADEKNLPFRPSRFVPPLERRQRAEIIVQKKKEKKEKRRLALLAARDMTSDNTMRKKSQLMKGKKPRTC